MSVRIVNQPAEFGCGCSLKDSDDAASPDLKCRT
jgi:hypothetical protein